ncbi:EAL domain-containing protein [Halalkalibacterium ligniniphilum]|uniref:EAL domain-containing protein n=1 Tax=Halalkalibacterium ligniniphilum TaxID=1134413 RepID=UPI000345BE4B|nr:EAL domain-containing protein [Halalkalibacterium ligniniphilum]
MDECSRCSEFPALESKGLIIFYEKQPALFVQLKNLLYQKGVDVKESATLLQVSYSSFDELTEWMRFLNEQLSPVQKRRLYGSYSATKNEEISFLKMTSFHELFVRISNRQLLQIINHRLFVPFLQPIVQLQKDEIYGYEFLLRQKSEAYPFSPGRLFAFSQQAGLQTVLDGQARIVSIEAGAKILKSGIKRFINFLPSSIYDPNHCLKSTFKAAEQFRVDPKDLVFEVVETEKIADVDHLKKIFKTYQEYGINVALDDIGSGFATLNVLQELRPNFAKIDRKLVAHCDGDKEKQTQIKAIIDISREQGTSLLAEGIERAEEAEFCKEAGIELAQGYYFGKPQPLPNPEDQIAS